MAQASRKSAGRRSTARRKMARRKVAGRKASGAKGRRWSAEVNKRSNALDLEKSVFKSSDPHKVALSLKRSAERSKRRKASPYQSAMSMLNFYINRAGKGLPQRQVRVLERAKGELRKAFGRQ
jgi:Protein of unknown function (DUF3175)